MLVAEPLNRTLHNMKILVIGSGGREHALLWALRKNSARPLDLYCAPGNAGIAEIATTIPINARDMAELATFSEQQNIDLSVVGPEAPLAAGIVDVFEERRLRIVGPNKKAARLESSKAFAKDFMRRHKVPTARYRVASSADEAVAILRRGDFGSKDTPVVIKADGLAAGKGVLVTSSRTEAEQAVQDLVAGGTVNLDAVNQIIIEETLSGPEVSMLLFSDGKDFRLMPAARDHKRVGENDSGPNTGGMGSVTDASVLVEATRDQIIREVVEPTLEGARAEGFPFRGVLFIGLMLTTDGPRVLEYNVRFGDPETQAILVRLRTDLVDIFGAIASQRLSQVTVDWSSYSSACVVLAARGYPSKPQTGARIDGLDRAAQREKVELFHAATSRGQNEEWLTAGGRVLGVTATGETLDLALSRCYQAAGDIHWDGMHYRRDIGRKPATGIGGAR